MGFNTALEKLVPIFLLCFTMEMVFVFVFFGVCFLLLNLNIFKPEAYGLEVLKFEDESFSIRKFTFGFFLLILAVLICIYGCNSTYDSLVLNELREYFFSINKYLLYFFLIFLRIPQYALYALFGACVFCGISFILFKLDYRLKIFSLEKGSPMLIYKLKIFQFEERSPVVMCFIIYSTIYICAILLRALLPFCFK